MCLRSILPKHVENDGFIDSTQRKKICFAPNFAEILYNPSSIKGNSCEGLTVACPHLFEWQNLKTTTSFLPWSDQTHEKKGSKENLST
jgi:hypothetical protein